MGAFSYTIRADRLYQTGIAVLLALLIASSVEYWWQHRRVLHRPAYWTLELLKGVSTWNTAGSDPTWPFLHMLTGVVHPAAVPAQAILSLQVWNHSCCIAQPRVSCPDPDHNPLKHR